MKWPDVNHEDIPRLRLTLGFVTLMALVTWLFIQAGDVSPEAHYRYLQSLRRVQQADVELNSAILASYADLHHNYDPVIRHQQEIRNERQRILQLPASVSDDARHLITQQVNELIAAQREKELLVDHFQRSKAILRNSMYYFPRAAESLMRDPQLGNIHLLGHFVRDLLAFGGMPNQEKSAHLGVELSRLERNVFPPATQGAISHLLVHARLIIDRGPEVDRLAEQITQAPTDDLLERVTRSYVEAHEVALRKAGYFRKLLYLVSIMLAAYVIYSLLRIERDRRALALAHRDLAERYAAQQRAESELHLYGTVFTHAAEGMMITDAEGNIVAVNPAFCGITGYQAGEAIGRTPAMLNSGRQGAEFYREMWDQLTTYGQWQGEIWNRRKDGGIFPEWLSIAAVHDASGGLSHYIGVFNDISERKQSEARINHMAHHDVLTGLPNRSLLEDRLGQAIRNARRSERPMAVVFIDLDRFKNINDTLGHEVGDNLLIQAAQRGLSVLRETDTLSRQGGDEFVVVLPDLAHVQDATHLTRKLLAALCQPYLLAGHELTVTGSAGIAFFPQDGQTYSELLRKADAAMYRAKSEGRNTFRCYSADANMASLDELLLANDLHGALERGELAMYYQPKVDARSGQLVGAEALMRWQHRDHGLISPARFIPLAEESGLISAFGEWAILNVCAQQRSWLDAGLMVVPIAVNISAQQFGQQDLPNLVAHALAEHGIPPQLLDLELTESLLMRNAGKAAQVLGTLRKMHVHVSIDDFGTGYSSLSYLNQFPVQSLKIDQSFVSQITEQGESIRLASAIIAMAHELELSVIAEGVETEDQRRYLLAHGCDQFQGYLFGRPQPAEQFARLIAERKLEDELR